MLNRKLLRDLVKSKWQYLSIALMVFLGVVFFNASYAAYLNLDSSYQSSYRELEFEDFGITFNAAPERVVQRIRRIPGILSAEGRLVEDVAIEIPRTSRKTKLVGRLITIPAQGEPQVNQLKLLRGRWLGSSSAREVLLEASFAAHHKLNPGDSLIAVRGNGRVRLTIAGIVQSGEYLYVVRSKQELMAVPDTFGVMFVSRDLLGGLVGKVDQINEIRATVTDRGRLAAIMRATKDALRTYEPQEPVGRTDQPSYQMLMQDVRGFQSYAILFPAFFLSVAAVAVYSLLLRMIHQQRPMIGLLRSLGYSKSAVVRHYLGICLLIGAFAGALGSLAGIFMARWTSLAYMSQLQVPVINVAPRWPVLISGFFIGLGTCVLGAIFPASLSARIKPAEAMRPIAPTYGRGALKLDYLFPWVKLRWRIPLRNVFRQPRRTFSTLFGIVSGVCLMMLARGLLDSTDVAIESIVSGAYRYDLRLDYIRYRSSTDVNRVASWPGVVRAEGVLEVPAEMRHAGKTYSAMVSGQQQGAKLHELLDPSGQPIRPPAEGAIFGPTLRKRLDLQVGDLVEMWVPEEVTKETSTRRMVRVAGFSNESIGTVATMDISQVRRLFAGDLELPPNGISGIVLKTAPSQEQEVRNRLYSLTDAGSVLSTPEIRALLKGMMKTIQTFVWIMELFGAALAFAMVFNMETINVLERSAEVATLRTIGFGRATISAMVSVENLAISAIGIAIGLPTGRWFVGAFWQMAQTPEQQDLFTFNVVVLPATLVFSAFGIFVVALLSQIPALVALARINPAQAVKERSV